MPTSVGDGFRGPDGRVGYLLRQANQAFRGAAQTELAVLGLTLPQYSVLSVADAEHGLSGAQLARDSMLTPQTTNEIITLLVAAGLMERRADQRDRRLRRIEVTAAGRKLLARARPAVHAVEERMVGSLRATDQSRLRRWLSDCAANLTADAADAADAADSASLQTGEVTR
jgi:DNA-binding MarR family transcriptional regulator